MHPAFLTERRVRSLPAHHLLVLNSAQKQFANCLAGIVEMKSANEA